MPEVVEADLRKSRTLKEGLKGPVHEVVAAHGRAYPSAKDEAVSLPEPRELFPFFLLARTVLRDGLHGPRGQLQAAATLRRLGGSDGERLVQLIGHLFASLAVEGGALALAIRVHRDLGAPGPVRAGRWFPPRCPSSWPCC